MTLNKYFKFHQERPNPTFPRRTYFAMHPNDIWQVDIVALNQKGDVGGVGSRGGVEGPKEESKRIKTQAEKGSGGYILKSKLLKNIDDTEHALDFRLSILQNMVLGKPIPHDKTKFTWIVN